ncbi:predicted protein [Nematostella vectensis]|uniref:G-protein coupled receptors family 1 profile domain-containing protein n=1 Tax=Nematostella vectensis TaxID=45351 RepID=A7RWK7_NEMVE|nr:predicted protein [Nematostella vectensis]|eukprot:XP_001636245.1 predicted protein [Nematostella vectensis]
MDNTTTPSQNHTRVYMFTPVPAPTKAALVTAFVFFGVVGILGNTIVLVFEWKKRKGADTPAKRKVLERTLTLYFMKSLALTDLFCLVIGVPLIQILLFADIFRKDWHCLVHNFPFFCFPCITIMNLVVISVESLSRFLQKRKREIRNSANIHCNASQAWRLKDLQIFVKVIFAFCIPYSAFFLYNLGKRFANLELSYELDYTVRMLAGVLAISNSALNPIIYFSSSRLFRSQLKNMIFPGRVTPSDVTQTSRTSQVRYIAGDQGVSNRHEGSFSNRQQAGFVNIDFDINNCKVLEGDTRKDRDS